MTEARPAPLQTIAVGELQLTFLPDGEVRFVPTALFPA